MFSWYLSQNLVALAKILILSAATTSQGEEAIVFTAKTKPETKNRMKYLAWVLWAHTMFGASALVQPPCSTRDAFLFQASSMILSTASTFLPSSALAVDTTSSGPSVLKGTIADDDLKAIIRSDIIDRQFLATGQITKAAYLPSATFTDEIDTYGLEQWVKGTQKLFVGDKSTVRLVGDIEVAKDKIEFRFDEDLVFRIPFRPTVSLSGKVVLERDPSTGLISSYREFWDQDVWTVIRTARF